MNIVFCHYRVKSGNEAQFEALLANHWPTLHKLGLVTDEPTKLYKGSEQDGSPLYIEVFEWFPGASERAHQHPDVMAIWEPMDTLCEARDGRPNMEFPHLGPLDV